MPNAQFQPRRPQIERYTRWLNPLPTPQHVDVIEGDNHLRPIRYPLEPGETVKIPSRYDRAIQTVDPNTNSIMGGCAPQLVNLDAKDAGRQPILPDALNTQLVEREAAELELARATIAVQHAENAAILAGAKLVKDKGKGKPEGDDKPRPTGA